MLARRLIPPKILEPLLAQLGVARRMLDGAVAEPILNGACVVPLIGQRAAARMFETSCERSELLRPATFRLPEDVLMQTIVLLDVLARWGYSEIIDATSSSDYDNVRDIAVLRDKRRRSVSFDDLAPAERYHLAFLCACHRPNLLPYLTGVTTFHLVQLDRTALGNLFVPPNVWKDSQGQIYRFSHYITTQTDEVDDARTIVIDRTEYRTPLDPLTIGRFYQNPIMLDGYHRAAVFWKFGPPDGMLWAYMPHDL